MREPTAALRRLTSYPGPCMMRREKRARYTLSAHALFFPKNHRKMVYYTIPESAGCRIVRVRSVLTVK